MRTPHIALTSTLKNFLLICACLLLSSTHASLRAQVTLRPVSENTLHGIELYKQGDFQEAVAVLKRSVKQDKKDADAWQYLGLAYKQQGKREDAFKTLKKAIGLYFTQLLPSLDSKQKYDSLSEVERATRRMSLTAIYRKAAESVEGYLQLQPEEADFWLAQLKALRFYAESLGPTEGDNALFYTADVTTKAVVLSKPEPMYTETARMKGTQGEATFHAVLAADGRVRHVLVLKALPHGLTETAFNAVHGIKFTPAIKDGRPVSQIATFAYYFNTY